MSNNHFKRGELYSFITGQASTARGMKEKEFEYIANKICDVLDNIEDKELHKKNKTRPFESRY